MREKKLLFVYNPCAGKGTMKNKLSDVIETFMKAEPPSGRQRRQRSSWNWEKIMTV